MFVVDEKFDNSIEHVLAMAYFVINTIIRIAESTSSAGALQVTVA